MVVTEFVVFIVDIRNCIIRRLITNVVVVIIPQKKAKLAATHKRDEK